MDKEKEEVMSLITQFPKIIQAGKRQASAAKTINIELCEEIEGKKPLSLFDALDASKPTNVLDCSDNMLIAGDNKAIMNSLLVNENMKEKINMIYIDPPFFSKADYDAVLTAGDAKIKHKAYGDKWERGLSQYLTMITARLYLMKDLLAKDGLIWVHLDWHAAHYVKIILDHVFGEKNFVNEIVWTYKSGGSGKKHFSKKHDTIFVYAKSSKYKFFPLQEKSYNRQLKPYRFKGVKEYKDEIGWYTMVNMKDVWNIDMVGRTSSERTGYATQKPEQLLERIIECCTEEGDICADFFCGSGTLPAVCAKMGRRFIGCDSGELAIESTIARLAKDNASFTVYNLKKPAKSNVVSNLQVTQEPIEFSNKELLTISLSSIKERGLAKSVDEKNKQVVKDVIKDDSISMVMYWSIDYDYDGKVHRPDVIHIRHGKDLETCEQKIINERKPISVKIVDLFGNSEMVEI